MSMSAPSRRAARALCTYVSIGLITSGCATASKDISANYVSPTQYQGYDCQQLSAESMRLQSRYVELGGRLDQANSNDKVLVGVGIVLLWPVLFALGGTKQQEAEYARLKGESEAVQQASIQRKCGMAAGEQVAAAASAPTPSAPAASVALSAN